MPAPFRTPRRWRARPLCLEILEDRTVPSVTQFDLAGLRFFSSIGFEESGTELTATSGTVSIGFTPAGTENFLPLIQADLTDPLSSQFTIENNPGAPKFDVKAANLSLVVVGGSPSVPIPIWQPNGTFTLPVDINQVTGSGFNFPSPNTFTKPFDVANIDFTLSGFGFFNPDGGDTSDAQVRMQGTATFEKVPILKDLGVTVNVEGDDYVIADHKGVVLTGLDVHVTLPTNATLAGLKLAGEIDVGYSHTDDSFTIGGGISLTSQNQGASSKAALENVSAELNVTLSKGQLTELGFAITTQFQILSLTVSTVQSQPLAFDFNFAKQQYEISGGLQLEFSGNTVVADFGNQASPGIIIKDGALTSLNAAIRGEVELASATLTTTGPNGLQVLYNSAKEQFEVGGGLLLTVPTGNTTQSISASLLDPNGGPGLIIQGGELTQLDMQLSGGFDIYGLKLSILNAGVSYVPADRSLLIGGTFNVDFEVFQTSLTLGTGTNPGLSIIGGKFKVDSVTFKLENAELGPVTLNELLVSYTAVGNSFDLDVGVNVTLPGGWEVAGEFDFVMGKLDTISIDVQAPPGVIEIPDTGLSIIDIHVKVTNLDAPSNIVVTGGIAVVWGEKINMLNQEVYLFRAEGDLTADADEFILDCQAQFGAYSSDNGTTWQGVLGQGDAKLTLDWQDNFYALHVEIDGLMGIFDIEGDLVFEAGKDIALLATASVVIPSEVPFIGGDTIGGLGFFFQHVFPHDNIHTSTTFAAWIDLNIIFWSVEVGFEIVIDDSGASSFSLIGSGTIDQFKQDVMPPVNQTYTYTADFSQAIPENATSAVLSADWTKSASGVDVETVKFRVKRFKDGQSTTFTEDQFEANGIKLISDAGFSGRTRQAIQIVGSTADRYAPLDAQYTLLVDITTQGGNPFPNYPAKTGPDVLLIQSTYQVPPPVFGPPGAPSPAVPQVPASPPADFTVTLKGAMDEAFIPQAKVSLYRVLLSDPFRRGVLVGKASPTAISPSGNEGQTWQATFTVPVEGLFEAPYVLYAVLDDGFNVPVQSGDSAPFTPSFAVAGQVANQNGDPLGGWAVFLDYNRNGAPDPDEPTTRTNPGGFYSFTRAFAAPGVAPVPVNTPFNVQLTSLSPADFVVPNNPVTVTFNGTDTVKAPFSPRERSAIKGTVFEDRLNNGVTADGAPVPGVVAYIDANGNGTLDAGEARSVTDSKGQYHFTNQAAGTYTVAVDLSTLSRSTPAAAYEVPAGTAGNETGAIALGMEFNVNEPVVVSSLGVFDSGGDGLKVPITAVLYDRATKLPLATLTFNPGEGTLAGGSRFLPLPNPLTLLPGFQGLIVASGYGPQEPWGGAGVAPPWTTDGAVGALTFVGTGLFGPPGTFPTTVGSNLVPNPYAAGTFLYAEPAWQLSKNTPANYSVTIDDSGFDLQEDKDFGALPPAFISGTVTGHPLQGGKVLPTPEPQAGTTVQLVADAFLTGVNAGGGASAGYLADAGFSGGQTGSTTAAIDTSAVFGPAPQAVYQTSRFADSFTYTLTGLTPQVAYAVRLHFAEPFFGAPQERQFNVSINGSAVLKNYDVFAAAGGMNTAVAESFSTFADAGGAITIAFTTGAAGQPFVNGIEVLTPGSVLATATTDARGQYVFPVYAPGPYTVREVPPAGWRQLSPFHSDLKFAVTDLPQAQGSASLALADFNDDGYIDVAWQTLAQEGFAFPVQVSYNQKDGTFGSPVTYNYPVIQGDLIVSGDFNGDKLPDLAVSSFGTNALSVLLNTGSPDLSKRFSYSANFWQLPPAVNQDSFTPFLEAADLNNDGLDDLLITYQRDDNKGGAGLAVLLNAKDAAGRSAVTYPFPFFPGEGDDLAGGVAVGDLNGDGHLDVAVNGGPANASFSAFNYAFGDGKGGLGRWISYLPLDYINSGAVALGDIQGKGALDVALLGLITDESFFALYTGDNRGDGTFSDPALVVDGQGYKAKPAVTDMILQDVNGDLKPDLILLQASRFPDVGPDGLVVFLNTGLFPFYDPAQPILFQLNGGGSTFFAGDLAAADVNNDGLIDIVVTNEAENHAGAVFLNQSPQNQPGFPVTLQAGQVFASANFVNVQRPAGSAVEGQVYDDVNRNGRQDTGEAGPAGRFVFVDLNRNGRYDQGEPSAATVAGGAYTIPGLADGAYSVGVFPEGAFKPAGPGAEFREVTVDGSSPARADFGRVGRLLLPIPDRQAEEGLTTTFAIPLAIGSAGRLSFSLEPGAPAGAFIDPATGTFSWAPTARQGGRSYTIGVRVRDPYAPTTTDVEFFTVAVGDVAAPVHFVRQLYRDVLGREPDAPGLASWVSQLAAGASRADVARGIWRSPEHRGRQVDAMYRTYLHREADPAGRAAWVSRLLGGMTEHQVALGFLTSAEYRRAHPDAASYLTGLYADVLGRAPDPAGLAGWLGLGASAERMAQGFLGSPEHLVRLVRGYYRTFLGRDGAPDELQAWMMAIQAGQSWSQVAESFLASDEFWARHTGA